MKILFILFTLLAGIMAKAQSNADQNPVYKDEIVITDLNGDTKNDTIRLYLKPAADDPGQYTKITISLDGRRITYKAKDSWDRIDKAFKTSNKNSVASDYVFIHKEKEQSYIILFGFPYGAGREEISIIKVSGRKIEMLFDNALGEPISIADLDGDGNAEFIIQYPPEIYKDAQKGQIGTYSPYLAYSLTPIFDIKKALSEEYNRKHYVWAGMERDPDIQVFYPNDGSKPKLNKSK